MLFFFLYRQQMEPHDYDFENPEEVFDFDIDSIPFEEEPLLFNDMETLESEEEDNKFAYFTTPPQSPKIPANNRVPRALVDTVEDNRDRKLQMETVVHFFDLDLYKWKTMVASKWTDTAGDMYPIHLKNNPSQKHVLFHRLLRIKVIPFPQNDIEALTNIVRQRFHMKEFHSAYPEFAYFGSIKALYHFNYDKQQVYLQQRLLKLISARTAQSFILAGGFVSWVFVLRIFPTKIQVTFVLGGQSQTSLVAFNTNFIKLIEAVEEQHNVVEFYIKGFDDRYFTEATTVLDIAKATNRPIVCMVDVEGK
jgi:hypothetical protein